MSTTQIDRDRVEHFIEEINQANRQMRERYDARAANPVSASAEDPIELDISKHEVLHAYDTPAGTESLEALHQLVQLGRAVGIRCEATVQVWPTSKEVQ